MLKHLTMTNRGNFWDLYVSSHNMPAQCLLSSEFREYLESHVHDLKHNMFQNLTRFPKATLYLGTVDTDVVKKKKMGTRDLYFMVQ